MNSKPKVIAESSPQEAAAHAARWIADRVKALHEANGTVSVAFSGGSTPGMMFDELAGLDLPWAALHIFQVDERMAPEGSPTRNLTELRKRLLDRVPIPASNVHPMPVIEDDLDRGARLYDEELESVLGASPRLDIVHLGLGADGHTASLVPNDDVLNVTNRDVAITASEYQGTLRMTLTYPMLDRAASIVWLAAGADKAAQVAKLIARDRSIPAGRVQANQDVLVVDDAAATAIDTNATGAR